MKPYEIVNNLGISQKSSNSRKKSISKEKEKILCHHCLRTATNGIRCMGICVADNDY